ncbi:MAG: EVE domain-containing protein [Phycisphaerales bacterium]|nr:EVE domain-containing protein [Planctomycetota bacterium]MCH8509752.1 EVE domain-containing protein [Phycisphaerales bacterium]
MATWLLKTEPDDYAFDDLVRDGKAVWDGVNNPAANIHLRAIKPGDSAFIYHTGTERRIAGLARVVSAAYEDPKHPGLNGKGDIARPVVDVEPVKAAKKSLTLADIKADARFEVESFELVRLPRLSVMPVPGPVAKLIRSAAGL